MIELFDRMLRLRALGTTAANTPSVRNMNETPTKSAQVAVESLRKDERGLATVEYAMLLAVVTVGGAIAVLSLGVPFVKMFRFQQLILALPFP